MSRRGFTLLEMLVASAIMALAVVGLLANLSTSMRNAANLSGYDRAVVLAREKMDELLIDPRLPKGVPIEGKFERSLTGDMDAGWRARLTLFEMPPNPAPGAWALERLELEVWWGREKHKRTLSIESFRRTALTAADVPKPE
jgi:general secretion pathway protein I